MFQKLPQLLQHGMNMPDCRLVRKYFKYSDKVFMLISIFLTLRYHNLYFFVIMRRPLLIFIAALPMLSSQCFTDGRNAAQPDSSQTPALPPAADAKAAFSDQDAVRFKSPDKVYFPETWFHFIGGNVSKEGIKADLEAIASAGISGIQLFHGQFGGAWPEVGQQITCLSPLWDDAVKYTAEECRRLGLRFTMQNCPGWAMSGGPWVDSENAMRILVWSRIDVDSEHVDTLLKEPVTPGEPWNLASDYRDIAVLAFPTPEDDTGVPLVPERVAGTGNYDWQACLNSTLERALQLPPSEYSIEVDFPSGTMVRTIQFPPVRLLNHSWCYEPGISFELDAILPDGSSKKVAGLDFPQSDWQDFSTFTVACDECPGASKYRLTFSNAHDMSLGYIKFFSAAMKNDWEASAAWTLRSIERTAEHPRQNSACYLKDENILDISRNMDSGGNLKWKAPEPGRWTILRIGHMNAGRQNAPAPAEGTGWECDKLSEAGPDAHFKGYIGRLVDGPLSGGLLGGMLMDSWECCTQTWTKDMEADFERMNGYKLRKWLPAVMGYVIDDPETTTRFLLDWKRLIGDLLVNKFFGGMASLAKENGLSVQYETAAGDVFPADIMEYFKYADIPTCEFWQPMTDGYVGSLDFKPIKPTASAAHLYGKPRVAAESFTSFNLTWDEHWEMLKEVANINYVEGVTHSIFHTYTHNPQVGFLPPGTSFGSGIGTPFLRGQTWWKHMPEFTTYLARLSYMLERGVSVSDVLWYLGDEINHKPSQSYPFPDGFKYDYCNPDVLVNRLSVKKRQLVTPEGIRYGVLWMPDTERMLPETMEKLYELVRGGATVIGNAPEGVASLRAQESQRFERARQKLWKYGNKKGVFKVGKGRIVVGMSLEEAVGVLGMRPDACGGALWLHRRTEGADWYFVTAPKGSGFKGNMTFRTTGDAEIWDPLTGTASDVRGLETDGCTTLALNLPKAGCCFVVFRHDGKSNTIHNEYSDTTEILRINDWTLRFPEGWGAPDCIAVNGLAPWKDLDISPEGKAFSGTVTYVADFQLDSASEGHRRILNLGNVEMIAEVYLNGNRLRTLWTEPYSLDITDHVMDGKNVLRVDVTSTWFNRLAYDAGLQEADRKTWTISGPAEGSTLRNSGLLGPVTVSDATLRSR